MLSIVEEDYFDSVDLDMYVYLDGYTSTEDRGIQGASAGQRSHSSGWSCRSSGLVDLRSKSCCC